MHADLSVAFVIGCQVAVMVIHAWAPLGHVSHTSGHLDEGLASLLRGASPASCDGPRACPPGDEQLLEHAGRWTRSRAAAGELSAAEETIRGLAAAAELRKPATLSLEDRRGPSCGNALEQQHNNKMTTTVDSSARPSGESERRTAGRVGRSGRRRCALATPRELLSSDESADNHSVQIFVRRAFCFSTSHPPKLGQQQKMEMMARGEGICAMRTLPVPWGCTHNPRLHFPPQATRPTRGRGTRGT